MQALVGRRKSLRNLWHALWDPSQSLPRRPKPVPDRPSRALRDPNQALGGPNDALGDPSQALVELNQALGSPNKAFGGPSWDSGGPSQALGDPGSPEVGQLESEEGFRKSELGEGMDGRTDGQMELPCVKS